MKKFFYNWMRGPAYIFDGILLTCTFGLIETDFGIMMDSLYIETCTKGEIK